MNFFESTILLINNHNCYLMSTVRWKSRSLQLSSLYGRPPYVHYQSACQSMRTHVSPVSPSFKCIIFVAKSLRSLIQEWFVFGLNWEQNYKSATTFQSTWPHRPDVGATSSSRPSTGRRAAVVPMTVCSATRHRILTLGQWGHPT